MIKVKKKSEKALSIVQNKILSIKENIVAVLMDDIFSLLKVHKTMMALTINSS